ncbi:MAG: PAS domain-containing protein [Sphingobium sp.]
MNQTSPAIAEGLRLIDENEQLRMQLEAALEENARITEDRDRLRHRVTVMAGELLRDAASLATRSGDRSADDAAAKLDVGRGETEEELRVAIEELQVLAEELEIANGNLLEFNAQLEERVEQRTCEIADANAALRQSEAALQAIADVVPDVLWRMDPAGRIDWVNERTSELTGKTIAELVKTNGLCHLHPDDLHPVSDALATSLANGTPFEKEHRILDRTGKYRWFLARMEPLRDEQGKIVQWFGAAMDMHDQRESMEALQESETRFRALVEGMPQLVWRSGNDGQWTWTSPQWRSLTGQTAAESKGYGWLNAFHRDDREGILAAWEQAPQSGWLAFEGRIFSARESRHRHFQTRALPVRGDGDGISEWLGTSTDMDDLLRLQNEQAVLVSELQHRTRNLMAVVQAIIVKTIKSSNTMEDFTLRIADRMQALARVQNLLSSRSLGRRIAFDQLLREELSAHVALDEAGYGSQVTLSGPSDILLRSATVQTLALALHELTTNAVKYGALSTSAGHLRISWEVMGDDPDGQRLKVDWDETGVDNVPDPNDGAAVRFGYGRELIERALPYQLGASTHYAFTPDGVACGIEVELR